MKAGALNPHTGRDFVQFGKTESVLNKGAEKIALLFNPPPVLSLEIIRNTMYHMKRLKDLTSMYGEAFGDGAIADIRKRVKSGLPRDISDR